MHAASGIYSALAVFVLFLHALFIVWVIFGALLTRSRPNLRYLHIASLVYPDISVTVLTVAGVLVCVLNLALYGRLIRVARHG